MLSSRGLSVLFCFVFSNLLAIFFAIASPIKAQKPDLLFLFSLNLSFVLIVLIVSVVILCIFTNTNTNTNTKQIIFSNSYNKNFMRFLVYLPICGLLLIAYDRIFIRHINYFQGIRYARYQWIHSTGGSWESIIGNFLISFVFVGFFYSVIDFNTFKKNKIMLFCSSLIVIGTFSLLNGGRSQILLTCCIFITAFLLQSSSSSKKNIFIIFIIFVITTVSCVTLSSVFLSDGNLNLKSLLLKLAYYLGGEPSQELIREKHSDVYYLIIYFLSYLYHAQWSVQFMSTDFVSYGSYLFYPFSILISKFSFGYIDIFSGGFFSDKGIFLSLPGAFYHDFGYFGLISLSVFIGIITGISLIVLKSTFIGGIKASFILINIILLLLSPILPAFGFMYLFYIGFSFFAVGLIFRRISLM